MTVPTSSPPGNDKLLRPTLVLPILKFRPLQLRKSYNQYLPRPRVLFFIVFFLLLRSLATLSLEVYPAQRTTRRVKWKLKEEDTLNNSNIKVLIYHKYQIELM